MLMSLMPGFRHVRVPIMAGAIWLLDGWILAADYFGSLASPTAPAFVRSLAGLGSALGTGVLVTATLSVAYLVGSLLMVDSRSGLLKILLRGRPVSVPMFDSLMVFVLSRAEGALEARERASVALGEAGETP